MEIKDLERRIAPAPLRAKAGFAKTHGRPSPTVYLRPEDLELDEVVRPSKPVRPPKESD